MPKLLIGIMTGLVVSYFVPQASLTIAIIAAIVLVVALEEKYRSQAPKGKKRTAKKPLPTMKVRKV